MDPPRGSRCPGEVSRDLQSQDKYNASNSSVAPTRPWYHTGPPRPVGTGAECGDTRAESKCEGNSAVLEAAHRHASRLGKKHFHCGRGLYMLVLPRGSKHFQYPPFSSCAVEGTKKPKDTGHCWPAPKPRPQDPRKTAPPVLLLGLRIAGALWTRSILNKYPLWEKLSMEEII